jgi:hypothetical protein
MQRNGIILAAALLVSCASAAHAFRSGHPLCQQLILPISRPLHPFAPAQPAEAPVCHRYLGSMPARVAGLPRPCAQPHMMVQRGGDRGRRTTQAPRRSGLSRNVPEEKLNRPRFIDEDDGCACWASVFLLCTVAA